MGIRLEIQDRKKGRRRKKEEEKPTIEKSFNVKNRNFIKIQREKMFLCDTDISKYLK